MVQRRNIGCGSDKQHRNDGGRDVRAGLQLAESECCKEKRIFSDDHNGQPCAGIQRNLQRVYLFLA